MAQVRVLFVYPHDIVGKVVDAAEGRGQDPAHAAVFACGGLLEAIRPGVTVSSVDKYADAKTEVFAIDVPDLAGAEAAGSSMIGKRYGLLTSCISGLIHDTTGLDVSLDPNDWSEDCSEVVTRYLRGGGVPLMLDHPADCITPKDLRDALASMGCIPEPV